MLMWHMVQVDMNLLIAMYPGSETGAVSLHSVEQDLKDLQSAGFLVPKPPVSWLFAQVQHPAGMMAAQRAGTCLDLVPTITKSSCGLTALSLCTLAAA